MTDAFTRMLLVLISDLFPGAVLMTTVSVVPQAVYTERSPRCFKLCTNVHDRHNVCLPANDCRV